MAIYVAAIERKPKEGPIVFLRPFLSKYEISFDRALISLFQGYKHRPYLSKYEISFDRALIFLCKGCKHRPFLSKYEISFLQSIDLSFPRLQKDAIF
jgi:hypothetical protein